MLSATELAWMRATLTASLPDTCTIKRPVPVSDSAGGFTGLDAPANLATGVACRLEHAILSPAEKEISEKMTGVGEWFITLPFNQDVKPQDQIVIGTRTFHVVMHRAGSWEIGRRVVVKEIV